MNNYAIITKICTYIYITKPKQRLVSEWYDLVNCYSYSSGVDFAT
jgi:hypothetical protein